MSQQWQTLDEYFGTPAFQEKLANEFPEDAAEWLDPVTRRRFLQLSGASIALATAVGCNPSVKPASEQKALQYVKKPEQITTGVPLYFASALTLGGYAQGILAKSYQGRPIKVEGNPSHPASLGGTDLYSQAATLSVFDPDRAKTCLKRNSSVSWDGVKKAITEIADSQRAKRGAGIRIVTEAVTSPTLAAAIDELKKTFPDLKWIQYEACGKENSLKASRAVFGKYVTPTYTLANADVIVNCDSDFLCGGAGGIRYTRDAMARRKVRMGDHAKKVDGVAPDKMSRIYAVESMPSGIGAASDHRLPLKPSEIESFLRQLAVDVGVTMPLAVGPLPENAKVWSKAVAKDLASRGGKAVVVVGDHLPMTAHAVAYAINAKLGAVGKTVNYIDPPQVGLNGADADGVADPLPAIRLLADDMLAGKVDALFLLGAVNLAYSAPADFKFTDALKAMNEAKKPVVRLATHEDETSLFCEWFINQAHELETWGDARAYDGTAGVQQPLIASIVDGHTVLEVISALLLKPNNDLQAMVKETWKKFFDEKKPDGTWDDWWFKVVESGVIAGTTATPVSVGEPKLTDLPTTAPATVADEVEITFLPDPTVYDGRFANNGWLQEAPKPMTSLTWDNALIMSPKTANDLKVGIGFNWFGGEDNFGYRGGEHGNMVCHLVEVTVGDRKIQGAAFVLPGHADGAITVHLGYGRFPKGAVQSGEDGKGLGFNANLIRTSNAWHVLGGLKIGTNLTKTGKNYRLACVQGQVSMEGRRPARHGTLKDALDAVKVESHGDHSHYHMKDDKHAFNFANNPNAAMAERDLMRTFLPGTPEERERLEQQYGKKDAVPAAERQFSHIRDAGYVNHAEHSEEADAPKQEHAHKHEHDPRIVNLTLIADHENNKLYRRWGMAIDLGACVGCSSCVVACVSENNIPVIGKTEVTRGRVMHWIRIDRYFATKEEAGGTEKQDPKSRWDSLAKHNDQTTSYVMPVPCQQCEKAPCETVCPVAATAHSADGLNDMAYNRCVGTRYCANNCPYKVRRFNFIQYADYAKNTSISLVNNPDVTVRTRGVMEKCTYCVQRIRAAEIEAEREIDTPGRQMVRTPTGIRPLIYDKEIKTACQSACPADAISFGDLNYDQYIPVVKKGKDYENAGGAIGFSQVSRWKLEPTGYGLLADLNTMPRTSYLAAIKNPNPDLVPAKEAH